ncbi:hypothetical protein Tco_0014544 [Tanacetum coccineum]
MFDEVEDDIEENSEDPEECGEDQANTVMGGIYDKLNNDWFNGTSDDEDDFEGILDYLEPSSYDGFIDLDIEAYNERRCRLLGLTYDSLSKELEFKVSSARCHVVNRYVLWKPSRDFTCPLGPPSGLKGLLHMLNATVIPTKGILGTVSVHFHVNVVALALSLPSQSRSDICCAGPESTKPVTIRYLLCWP